MINNTLQHKELPIYGDGMQIRDWLYVEDHCKAIDMVVRGGKLGEVYNVGGHNERPNIVIVKTNFRICKSKNVDPAVGEHMMKHVADRKGHDRRYGIDPEKIKRDLGWYPETTFEVGIEKDHPVVLEPQRMDGKRHQRRLSGVLSEDVQQPVTNQPAEACGKRVFSLAATSALHV